MVFIVVLWKQHETVSCVCFDYMVVIWTCNQSRGREGKTKTGVVSLRCLRHDYINILMPVAVHNAVNCSWEKNNNHILSSFMIYKYMYELHLTEVLLINNTKMKLCACAGVWEKKLWLPLNIKQHVSYKEKDVFLFYVFVSPFSNTIEPKGHFIDHSEVMSPIVCLLSLTWMWFFFSIRSTYSVQYK